MPDSSAANGYTIDNDLNNINCHVGLLSPFRQWWAPDQSLPDDTQGIRHVANPFNCGASYNPTANSSTDDSWNDYSPHTTPPSFSSTSQSTITSGSPATSVSRRESVSTQLDNHSRKRAAEPEEQATRKQPKRSSTKSKSLDMGSKPKAEAKSKSEAKSEAKSKSKSKPEPKPKPKSKPKPKPKSRSRSKAKQPTEEDSGSKPSRGSLPNISVASPNDNYGDETTKKIQERNRIASNKFRVKKREDAEQLRADELVMEEANRNLSRCVADLTLQVYNLKMQLLQHTDCDCALIQGYISNEARRYIHDLGDARPQNKASPHHHT